MRNYNRVILMGNLTRDPELRNTSNQNQVCNLGIAVNRTYTDQTGNRQEDVTFVDCEAWGSTAKIINKHLAKGQPIHIEGRLRLDQWQDDDGNNRSKLKVVIDRFQFVGTRPDGQQASEDEEVSA